MDDVHRPVFPDNARSNRLFRPVGRNPYDQPASLSVLGRSEKFKRHA
jgi:hypothetical protein